jgi:transcriptional regulator with XRE-family HTH domain
MDLVHRKLAARIRELRRRRKWSANHLADFSGLGRGYLSEVESAKKSPTLRTLVKLAEALQIEVGDLFSEKGG